MTTIVAVQTEDDVIFGWDSQLTRGNEVGDMVADKVWVRDGLVFAVSGSARFMDLVYAADFPDYDGSEARRWVITKFVPALQDVIERSGHGPALLDQEELGLQSGLILVVDGQAYIFDAHLSPAQTAEGVYTMGSGGDYARGAIFAGANIEKALEVASLIDPFSGGELHIASANELIMGEEVD